MAAPVRFRGLCHLRDQKQNKSIKLQNTHPRESTPIQPSDGIALPLIDELKGFEQGITCAFENARDFYAFERENLLYLGF